MTRAAADALLLELGDRMGLPGLHLDRAGCCHLAFDGRWLVTLAIMPGGRLFLHCPIGAPATAEAERPSPEPVAVAVACAPRGTGGLRDVGRDDGSSATRCDFCGAAGEGWLRLDPLRSSRRPPRFRRRNPG